METREDKKEKAKNNEEGVAPVKHRHLLFMHF